jgi:hypothetical protein
MRTRHRGNVRTWLYQKYFSRSCRKLKNYSLSSRRKLNLLGEIHHCLAEINQFKSIIRNGTLPHSRCSI